MNGLIAFIMVLFLVTGAAYGVGARNDEEPHRHHQGDGESAFRPGRPDLAVLVISQFVAYFNYSNIGTIMAVKMADVLKTANIGPLWLLIGFIVVVAIIDLLITGAIAKWAIFAPIFVPLLMKLGVDPEAVLAAYRVGDSPINSITPLNAYFALVVGVRQEVRQERGRRDDRGADVALRRVDVDSLDAAVRGVVYAGTSLGIVIKCEEFSARTHVPRNVMPVRCASRSIVDRFDLREGLYHEQQTFPWT